MMRTGDGRGYLTVAFQTGTPQELLGHLNDVEAKNAPDHLFYQGDVELLRNGPRVSVIGTRKPSSDGISRATALSRELVSRQVVIVSGLAEGIDRIAHLTAIDCSGQTIAVEI